MFRLSGLVFLVFSIGCGTLLFLTSQSVQKNERQLGLLQNSNKTEIETLRVLSAEWDYLNRPERLEYLTTHSLDLDETLVDGQDFVSTIRDVPEPVLPVLPSVKPSFLQHVSSERVVQKKLEVINEIDPHNFDKLIGGLSERGGE